MAEAGNEPGVGLKPYGHHLGDGIVQVCFTLPVGASPRASEAALAYAEKMGLKNCRVTWMEAIGPHFTYFIIYGAAEPTLDWDQTAAQEKVPCLLADTAEELDRRFREQLGRRVSVLAYVHDSTAEAIEFEALLSWQGIAGEIGLEGYSTFYVHRQRERSDVETLLEKARSVKADILLLHAEAAALPELAQLDRRLQEARELPAWFLKVVWQRGTLPAELAYTCVSKLHACGITVAPPAPEGPSSEEAAAKKRGLWRWFG